jgi:predicted nucleic acid-binding protein
VAKSKAVFDASVILRAVVDSAEDAKSWLDRLVAGDVTAVVPDLLYAEVANAFLIGLRNGRLRLDQAIDSLAAVAELPFEVRPCRLVFGIAFATAVPFGLTAYDAHYFALAEAEGAVLVTADRALAAAASRGVLLA